MRPSIALLLATAMLSGCATTQPAPTTTPNCTETPTTTKVVNGFTLYGKGGEVFLVFSGDRDAPWSLRKATYQKMMVVVDHPIIPTTDAERIPNSLNVLGRNLFTGTVKTFEVGRHNSEFGIGVEWGGDFDFPDAGCWELRLSAPGNTDTTIVVKVL